MKAIDKIFKARERLILSTVFFGALCIRLIPKEDTSCDTAWTDGIHIGYNPKFIETLSMAHLVFVLAHEVLHCVFNHHTRRNGRDAKKWNVACDYAINIILTDYGYTLLEGALYDEKYRGMDVYEIYRDLYGNDMNDDDGDQQSKGSSDPGECGEVRDFPEEDGEESKSENEQNWKQASIKAQEMAERKDEKVNSRISDAIYGYKNPRTDWRSVLNEFLTEQINDDYTFTTPNRRYLAHKLYMPGMDGEQMKEMVFIVDTSGSVKTDMLNQFWTEIKTVLELFDEVKVTILHVDNVLSGVEVLEPHDEKPETLVPKSTYGGTDFRPGFEWIEENEIDPGCVIYYTDGMCRDYPQEPDYPVLWAKFATEWDGMLKFNPPFGQVVPVDYVD